MCGMLGSFPCPHIVFKLCLKLGNADAGTVLDCGRGAVLTALADVHRLLERAAPQVKAAAGSVDGLRPKDLAAMSRKAG